MRSEITDIPGVVAIHPMIHRDRRGLFLETWQGLRYAAAGVAGGFPQDGLSRSRRRVLRGLHFQIKNPQGHLVTVLRGRIFDVAVDLRRGSPTFARWVGRILDSRQFAQLWLPPGVAHGFCVLGAEAMIHYKMSGPYVPGDEGGVLWSDPDLAIGWPLAAPVVSARDREWPRLADIPASHLPQIDFDETRHPAS